MSQSKILNNIKKHMFSADVIHSITSELKIKNTQELSKRKNFLINDSSLVENIEKNESINSRTYCFSKGDKLFWCIYYIHYGENSTVLARNNIFTSEKKIKFSSLENLKKNKDILKIVKGLKMQKVEDDLINKQNIGVVGLLSFAILWNIGILYKKNNTIMRLGNIENIKGYIEDDNKGIRVFLNDKGETVPCEKLINEALSKYYLIENPIKPINAISSYKVKELQQFAEELAISIKDMNNKNKKKEVLYLNIKEYLKIEDI